MKSLFKIWLLISSVLLLGFGGAVVLHLIVTWLHSLQNVPNIFKYVIDFLLLSFLITIAFWAVSRWAEFKDV